MLRFRIFGLILIKKKKRKKKSRSPRKEIEDESKEIAERSLIRKIVEARILPGKSDWKGTKDITNRHEV